MAILIPRKKAFWQRKPYAGGEVDLANEIASELYSAGNSLMVYGDGSFVGVNGAPLTNNNGYGVDDTNRYEATATSNYVEIGPSNILDGATELTVCAEVVAQAIPVVSTQIVSQWGGTFVYQFAVDASGRFFFLVNGGSNYAVNFETTLLDEVGESYSVAVKWTAGNAIEGWVNGVRQATSALLGTPASVSSLSTSGSNKSRIGYKQDGGAALLGGIGFASVTPADIDDDHLQAFSENPYQIIKPRRKYWVLPTVSGTTAALTGTITTADEADIVATGGTVLLDLTDDTWVSAGATFDAQRQPIINGLTSAQSELTGWNNEVRDNLAVTAVVRTSDNRVTITIPPSSGYDITSPDVVTDTIPAAALVTSAIDVVASPSFTISVAASTFQAAWAARTNNLIGAGLS